jgi:hypothetical protein
MCHLENYTMVIKENTLLIRISFDKFDVSALSLF